VIRRRAKSTERRGMLSYCRPLRRLATRHQQKSQRSAPTVLPKGNRLQIRLRWRPWNRHPKDLQMILSERRRPQSRPVTLRVYRCDVRGRRSATM